MDVRIDGKKYVPYSEAIRPPKGRYASDYCYNCGKMNFTTTDSRSKDGFRHRWKMCMSCGYKWRTIEQMYLPKGRPPKGEYYEMS